MVWWTAVARLPALRPGCLEAAALAKMEQMWQMPRLAMKCVFSSFSSKANREVVLVVGDQTFAISEQFYRSCGCSGTRSKPPKMFLLLLNVRIVASQPIESAIPYKSLKTARERDCVYSVALHC